MGSDPDCVDGMMKAKGAGFRPFAGVCTSSGFGLLEM